MKKGLLALFLFLLSLHSFSQTTSFGINGGFGKTWNTNRSTNYESRDFNFQTFGLSALRTTKSHFGFGADINYSFEGSKMSMQDRDETPSSFDISARLQYLRVPLKAYYFFGKSSSAIRPKIYFAPSFGYLVRAFDIGTVSYPGGTSHNEQNTTSMYRRFDFGLQGGLGLNFRLSDKTILTTDLNYYNGFLNTWGGTRKNNNASINIGMLWNIRRR